MADDPTSTGPLRLSDPASLALRLLNEAKPKEAAPLMVEAGERALAAGDPETARAFLDKAAEIGVADALVPRLAVALAEANRYLSRHRDTVKWIERRLAAPHEKTTHAVLLRARIAALRQINTRAVLDLAEEALAAAEAVGDMDSYANVLANASFAAYRRGDVRAADRYATLARSRTFPSETAEIDALRAQLFAYTVAGFFEQALATSLEIRRRRLATGDLANAANESNNVAESLLELGRPVEARAEAQRAAELAAQAGHRAVERFARVLIAVATAEAGDLDEGIALLRGAGVDHANAPLGADTAAALSYWLVERNRDGDAAEAVTVAAAAVERAASAGISHLLTRLLATQARAHARLGQGDAARDALARARAAADSADALAEMHLALTMAEVLAESDPARAVALSGARARLLRAAGRRDDPLAFCTAIRLHRRLLELSGGVPTDLPRAP